MFISVTDFALEVDQLRNEKAGSMDVMPRIPIFPMLDRAATYTFAISLIISF